MPLAIHIWHDIYQYEILDFREDFIRKISLVFDAIPPATESKEEKGFFRGPRGHRGHTGSKGEKGDTGKEGKRGHTGPRGTAGVMGPVGPTGESIIIGGAAQGSTGTAVDQLIEYAPDPNAYQLLNMTSGYHTPHGRTHALYPSDWFWSSEPLRHRGDAFR